MQTSQEHQSTSDGIHRLYHQPMQQQVEPYFFPSFQILNNGCPDNGISQATQVSFQSYNEHYCTLDSSPATGCVIYDTPSAGSISSSRTPFSPQNSQSYLSYPLQSSDNIYGSSPVSGSSSVVDDGNELWHTLRVMKIQLLGPESDIDDSCSCSFKGITLHIRPAVKLQ
ncbi:GRAS [Sarracenia purpurea var. burkii]